MRSLSPQSPFLQAEQTKCPQPLLIRPPPSRPFPILVASFGCSLIASCLSYHGTQKSHTGLKVRPHLQIYLSKGKRKEPRKPHTAHCWQTLKICPHCKNMNCKHPQPLYFHSFVYLGDELDAQRLSDLIFPFLQLERPIQLYQTTLLSLELFGSLRFITKHCVLKSQKSEMHLSPTRQKQTTSRKWANPGMAVEEHDMRHLNCSSPSEPELEELAEVLSQGSLVQKTSLQQSSVQQVLTTILLLSELPKKGIMSLQTHSRHSTFGYWPQSMWSVELKTNK